MWVAQLPIASSIAQLPIASSIAQLPIASSIAQLPIASLIAQRRATVLGTVYISPVYQSQLTQLAP